MSELQLTSVSSGYGKVGIVNDVSLDIRPGEIVAVIGRNGVGKTTLMKTIVGEIRPTKGRIEFGYYDLTRMRPSQRARLGVGYVPQGRGIFARLTVGANLSLGRTVGNAKRVALDRAFKYFPILEKRESQLAGSMSGGEQQQLAIGRVLCGDPKLLLLDEPSEGIQPSIVKEIAGTILRLRNEASLGIIIVEQNLTLIQAVADRCLVMDKGAIVATIAPEELDDPETARRYLAI